ncbi:hypothetical protein EXIGLDRAFT_791765 [Exidia glandulosa HHB12029]|uniref:C2H2-type domain-containing protein n=1 Tax=Exidia glandulosa HHB12029 TaxID=1314781 RepID=A0A165HAK7_EXIGL|nr:hypothetical protein EXIGLDRAFT_791765 [Exidia glandulosa HHB12029]
MGACTPPISRCTICPRRFQSNVDVTSHRIKEHKFCMWCGNIFVGLTEPEILSHYGVKHSHCHFCRLFFKDEEELHFVAPANLDAHLRSWKHTVKDVRCYGCHKTLVSRAAMLAHIEMNTCVSGLTRAKLNGVARGLRSIFTVSDPVEAQRERVVTQALSGRWRCYCGKSTRTCAGMNAHLSSPVHDPKLYRCPLEECEKETATLSGLFQHLESMQCPAPQTFANETALFERALRRTLLWGR